MNNQQRGIVYQLQIRPDRSGQEAASRGFALIQRNAEGVATGMTTINAEAIKLARNNRLEAVSEELLESVAAGQQLEAAIEDAAQALARLGATSSEIQQVSDSLGLTERDARSLSARTGAFSGDERFQRLSNQVGQAGDIQTNLGAIIALSGLGGGGAGGIIGVAAEVVALAEELPRLGAAVRSLPNIVSVAAQAIGPAGFAIGAALTGLVVTFNEVTSRLEENARDSEQFVQGFAELTRELEDGSLTTEEARRRLDELSEQRRVEQIVLQGVQQTYDQYIAQQGLLSGAAQALSADEQQLADSLNEQRRAVRNLDLDIQGLTAAIESGRAAANDRAVREREAANRQLGVIEQLTTERLALEQFAASASAESIEDRLAAIQTERGAILEATAVIRSLGTQTDETREALQNYNDRLLALGREEEFLTDSALSLVEARQMEAESIEFIESATRNYIDELQRQAGLQVQLARLERDATVEGVTTRIENLQIERDALLGVQEELFRLAMTSEDAARELANTQTRLRTIDEELGALGSDVGVAAIGRSLEQLRSDIEAIATESGARITSIGEKLNADVLEEMDRAAERIREVEARAGERRGEIIEDTNRKIMEATERLGDRRAEIERRFNQDRLTALENRDAVGLIQAQRRRDEDLEQAEDAFGDQIEAAREAQRQRLQDLRASLFRERIEIQRESAGRILELQNAANQAIIAERSRAAQEIAIRQQAVADQLVELERLNTDGTPLVVQFVDSIIEQLGRLNGGEAAETGQPTVTQTVLDIISDVFNPAS